MENIVTMFINCLIRASNSELRNEFIDRNTRPKIELITFDELFVNFGLGLT